MEEVVVQLTLRIDPARRDHPVTWNWQRLINAGQDCHLEKLEFIEDTSLSGHDVVTFPPVERSN